MVALRDIKSRKPVFYFWGSDEEWDKLIYGSLNKYKNVYLWDRTVSMWRYPPQVKIIKSQITAKRFFGMRLDPAVIFVNAIPIGDVLDANKVIDWHGGMYFIVRFGRIELLQLAATDRVDLCSRKYIKYIRMFK